MGGRTHGRRVSGHVGVESLEERRLLAAQSMAVEPIPVLRGTVETVELAGDLAYIGEGSDLVVLNVADARHPAVLGRVTLPGHVTDIEVQGNHAYVAAGTLQVVDVTQPSAPQRLSMNLSTYRFIHDLAVSGNHLYTADGGDLSVYDISDPAHLAEQWNAPLGMFLPQLTLAGQYLVAGGWEGGYGKLMIYDLRPPGHPELVGTRESRWGSGYVSTGGVSIPNSYVVVPNPDSGRIPITAPGVESPDESPGLIVRIGMARQQGSVVARVEYGDYGRHATVSWYDMEAETGDHSGSWDVPGRVADFEMSERLIAAAAGEEGLWIRLRSNDAVSGESPEEVVGIYDEAENPAAMAVAGSRAYVTDRHGVLKIYDVSDPRHARVLGSTSLRDVESGLGPARVLAQGHYVYAFSGNQMRIVSVADASAPVVIGFYASDDLQFLSDVAVVGTQVYMALAHTSDLAEPTYVDVIDVSSPASPTRERLVTVPQAATAMAVRGELAYLVAGLNRLLVVNIGGGLAEGADRVVGQVELPQGVGRLYVEGSYAYVAGDDIGVLTVDISNPAAPRVIGERIPTRAVDLAANGRFLYAVGGIITMLDLRDPAAPVVAGEYWNGGYPSDAALVGMDLYLANGQDGLTLLRTMPTVFVGTEGDDRYTVRMAEDGVTAEVFENAPTTGAPSYRIGASVLSGLSLETGDGNDSVQNLTSISCTISGGGGNDTLIGGSGVDWIDSGAGMDSVSGGAGADRVVVDASDTFVAEADDVVVPGTPLLLGAGKTRRFVDADGDLVSVRLSGHGSGEVFLSPSGDVGAIMLAGTDNSSVLTISVAGHRRYTTAQRIDLGAGSLKQLAAARVELRGGVITSTAGTIGTLSVRAVLDGTRIDLPGEVSGRGMNLTAAAIYDSRVTIGGRLNHVKLGGMWGSKFAAPSITSLVVSGRGDTPFGGDLTLTDPGTASTYTLRSAIIRGRVDQGIWSIAGRAGSVWADETGDSWEGRFSGGMGKLSVQGDLRGTIKAPTIGSIRVGGSMEWATIRVGDGAERVALGGMTVLGSIKDSTIQVDGDIGTVTAGAMERSGVYARRRSRRCGRERGQ